MQAMKRSELVRRLADYLHISEFDDISTNGLVVGAPGDREIRKVSCAVDATLGTFRLAAEAESDMLFVHHGLFWGSPIPVTGPHYARIRFLMDHGIDLFVCHIPLDAHPEVGNNAVMAKILGLGDLHSFAPFRGKDCGWWGTRKEALSVEEIVAKLGFTHPVILPYGPKKIHTVGIVSGGGSGDVAEAIALGLDCFITGAVMHEQASDAEENGITMIGGGHWASEVFGPRAVAEKLEEWGLETEFLSRDTGL